MKQILTFLLFIPLVSAAQYTEKEVVEFLAANHSRLWFFDRYKISMASSEKCDTGESYTFETSKKVKHKKCVDGQWQSKELTWSLKNDSPFDWWITVGDKTYALVMTDLPQEKQVHLRDKAGESKIDPAYDILLTHYIDD